MKTTCMTLVLTAIISWAPVVAFAAKVVVVHGINGKDVASSQELPVDVAVDGNCALVGLTFGGSRLVELAAGSYNITVHPSSGACSTQLWCLFNSASHHSDCCCFR